MGTTHAKTEKVDLSPLTEESRRYCTTSAAPIDAPCLLSSYTLGLNNCSGTCGILCNVREHATQDLIYRSNPTPNPNPNPNPHRQVRAHQKAVDSPKAKDRTPMELSPMYT
ncbi:unnamed protein product, partial [Ectocarpus sp. 8 AP-2014]